MLKRTFPAGALVLVILFIISRVILDFFGVRLDYTALYSNWQYLDVDTLHNNLLEGIWYDHTQPPVFNLLLGLVLKIFGNQAEMVFIILFKLITLANSLLILVLLKRSQLNNKNIPLAFSLVYLLSPATLIFENELFYTTFITLMLLVSCYYLQNLQQKINWKNAICFFLPLVIICMTRSMYHIVWLVFISLILIIYFRKNQSRSVVIFVSLITVLLTGSWYLKNYFLFKSFSTSTWIGMNMARNVFHDAELNDSSKIQSIIPFSRISAYNKFIPPGYENEYKGWNDTDLLQEMKNDTFINVKHIDYIPVSKEYTAASIKEIKDKPVAYLKNVIQSGIIYFAPATLYPTTVIQARKIKYYDMLYSFNLSSFAKNKQERRFALLVSAIPKMIIYSLVFFYLIRQVIKTRKVLLLHLFISATIGYIFCISSLFEHYENMRFRYEAEPLFLVLAAYIVAGLLNRKNRTAQTN